MKPIAHLIDNPTVRASYEAYTPDCPHCADRGEIEVETKYPNLPGVYYVRTLCPHCQPDYCSSCGGRGEIAYNVPVGDTRFGRLFPCPDCDKGRALQDTAYERALKNARVPAEYQGLTFATWDALPETLKRNKFAARIAVALWCAQTDGFTLAEVHAAIGKPYTGDDSRRKSLLLTGPVGTGKTGLAAAAVNYLAAQGVAVLYTRTADLFTSLHAAYERSKRDQPGESAEEILERYKRAPVLVLDEFSTYQTTEWRQAQAEELIRFRYGEGLRTLVTTNASRDETEAEWGLRTASALYGMAHVVPCEGVSLRHHATPQGGW
jgi:DNA replication protein DnaC